MATAVSQPLVSKPPVGPQSKGPLTVDFDDDEWCFVLELYDVRSRTKDNEIISAIHGIVPDAVVEIRRMGTQNSLAVFGTAVHARAALELVTPLFKSRPMCQASEEVRARIRHIGLHHTLKPAIRRPPDDKVPRTTSKGIKIGDEIEGVCRSVDMQAVVEILTSDYPVDARLAGFLGIVEMDEDDLEQSMKIVDRIQEIFRQKYPNCVATLFGSVVTGLGLKGSDLDVYVELGEYRDEKKTDAEYVAETIRLLYSYEAEFIIIRKVALARVPIIRLFSTALNTTLDISFSNAMGVLNSRLLKSYMDFDPMVYKVVQTLRWWAKTRALTSRQGGFTSYSIVWLVLNFFMNRQKRPKLPPVYSVLKAAKAKGCTRVIEGWECGVVPIEEVPEVRTYEDDPRPPSITDLLREFFSFYSQYDFTAVVTCPFLGRPLPRAMFADPRALLPLEMAGYIEASSRPDFEPIGLDHAFVTQDPFRLGQNLNRNTVVNSCERFIVECKRSDWTLSKAMARTTPHEGMYAVLQLALGETQARRAAQFVYNDEHVPSCPVKYPELRGGLFLTFGLAPSCKYVVHSMGPQAITRDASDICAMHYISWRDMVMRIAHKILGDCLLFDVWDLAGVPGPEAMNVSHSNAVYVPVVPQVTPEELDGFCHKPFSFTDSAAGYPRPCEHYDWIRHWQHIDREYFTGVTLTRLFHSHRGKRVVDMMNTTIPFVPGVLLKRFFCEARWPTFHIRRDGGKTGTLAEETIWSATLARILSGSVAVNFPTRPVAKFDYIVEFYEAKDMPLGGILIRCLYAPVSPGGSVGNCELEHSLAVFIRSLLTSELKALDAGAAVSPLANSNPPVTKQAHG